MDSPRLETSTIVRRRKSLAVDFFFALIRSNVKSSKMLELDMKLEEKKFYRFVAEQI